MISLKRTSQNVWIFRDAENILMIIDEYPYKQKNMIADWDYNSFHMMPLAWELASGSIELDEVL